MHDHGLEAVASFELLKIECVVPEGLLARVVEAFDRAAFPGGSSEGTTVVSDVEEIVTPGRIRP